MMAVDKRLAAAVLLLCAAPVVHAARCSFMQSIPRPDRPVLPEVDTDLVWAARPLFPLDEERDEVCVEDFPMGSSRDQFIYMDEEIESDVYIARLNYYGTEPPEIVQPFLWGTYLMLGPQIRLENEQWFLVITLRQDYETPGMQQYSFDIRAPGESALAQVSLFIVNIDDNAPIIRPRDEACRLEELGPIGLTDCEYVVTDIDGRISTSQMTFEIDSNRLDHEIFYIQGDLIPDVWDTMHMTIGLNQSLNFVTNPLHVFNITALDSYPNSATMTTLVQVINVESRPPRWIDIFAVQQFDEKTNQTFRVEAIDGDTGINSELNYTLIANPEDPFFSIETIDDGRSGAWFRVSEIDRDALEKEVFQVTLIAYKHDIMTFYENTSVVIIVNDVNDQRPKPLSKEYFLDIMEETPQTLAFSEDFGFHDRDLGEHAQYNVTLEDIYPEGAASAFYIAPEVGYQRQTFIMGTLNHSMLDYEEARFQKIAIRVLATDMHNTSHTGEAIVYINLINWNDEEPIFAMSTQTVWINETEGEGHYVATALAEDRDYYDEVVHSLLGNAVNFLTIDSASGEIYVSANDSFDYHRQNELFVQIQAIDTLGAPYHTATSQLVIRLHDINNTPPTLRLARGSPNVEENVPEGYEIEWSIRATDPDTTAELRFEIDWDTSYATKQGRETNAVEYHGCLEIETLYPEDNNRGVAEGRLVVKEIRNNVTIDFEEFEVLYLTIRVIDLETVYGENNDESTFTITIVDMNDNRPEWVNGTLDQEFRVTEMATSDTAIGSVLATDIDGPLYNQVRYTIRPYGDTPEDLVKIDFYTGQLTVDRSEAIDADEPPRYYLNYTVTASDCCYAENRTECPPDDTCWNTEDQISIRITDTNNKWPHPIYDEEEATEEHDYVVRIYENATEYDEVAQLAALDLDRDEIYHNVSYQINYGVAPRLRAFFSVELDTGRVYVDYTTDERLDRDGDEPQHEIFMTLIDNFLTVGDGRRNQNETSVLVILMDVNDNAPEMPHPSTLPWSISENRLQASPIDPIIHAHDRDQPDDDNSRVSYDILNVSVNNREDLDEDLIQDLFYMETFCHTPFNCSGRLWTNADLMGFWGTYDLLLQAHDHGDPRLYSNETYELEIRPFNFHSPAFVFPIHGSVIRLAQEWATVNGMLMTVGGTFLERIEATDEDGLHAGEVTFRVSDNAEAMEYLEVLNEGENSGTLRLIQAINVEQQDPQEFLVTITATDRGTEPGSLSTACTIRVIFVPTQGEPIFSVNTATVAFFEGEQGLYETFELPLAEDPKNYECDGDCHDIYYRIADGNAEGLFALDSSNNILYLASELDRNVTASYVLVVAASNSLTGPVLTGSSLTVTVNVREANPRPIFLREVYSAGISTANNINWEILTVQAVHSEGDTITYSINETSMVVDSTLEQVRDNAFNLDPDSGVLTLNMRPTASMHGMFEFDVIANDTVGAMDTAEVKVYLISALNRVIFTFVNTLQTVEEHDDFIAQTFTAGFNMTCNIDQIVQATDSGGVALDTLTEVRAHFIRDNVPVSAEEIEELRSDTLLLRRIQTTLNTNLLVLQDFVTEMSPEPTDPSLVTVYVLGGLSALLGFMCLVLLLTFFIKTRALNRRLQALSMTKYGSQDSGMNRVGIAPGTNMFAAEGANPIWNESIKAPDFDAVSDASDDSDLVGVEELAQFNDDYFPPGDTNSLDDIMPSNDTVANHSNQFGFYTSPFSAEFTHSNLKKK